DVHDEARRGDAVGHRARAVREADAVRLTEGAVPEPLWVERRHGAEVRESTAAVRVVRGHDAAAEGDAYAASVMGTDDVRRLANARGSGEEGGGVERGPGRALRPDPGEGEVVGHGDNWGAIHRWRVGAPGGRRRESGGTFRWRQ